MESLSVRKTFLFPKGACPFNIQIRVRCKGDSNFKCLASIYLNGAILMQRQGQNGRHRLKKVVWIQLLFSLIPNARTPPINFNAILDFIMLFGGDIVPSIQAHRNIFISPITRIYQNINRHLCFHSITQIFRIFPNKLIKSSSTGTKEASSRLCMCTKETLVS